MEKILVLDFGGQYNQLIARRVREESVYAEIRGYDKISLQEIKEAGYKGIIFTGGPNSVYEESSPHYDPALLDAGIPILGICYGIQLMAYMAGGVINTAAESSEYGKTEIKYSADTLFKGMPEESICWMSHTDHIIEPPQGFKITAHTEKCPCAAFADEKRKLYGVQFHPEVTHTQQGKTILKNFLYDVCGCAGDWKMDDYIERTVAEYREKLQGKKVLLGLSGGVDSSVAAALLHRAVGDNLVCVFLDHGLLRKDEGDFVEETFAGRFGMKLIRANVEDRFLARLKGVTDPELKRKIVGEEFVRVFEEEASKIGHIDVLAQGTIYPDVIESGLGASAVIKSHHNVGGLPENIAFTELAEPLRDLFKDEVRKVGMQLGLPRELVYRQPFPGPGLSVRVIGEVTRDKLDILREADAIFRQEVGEGMAEGTPDQYFAALLDVKSVGVMGDARTYGYVLALRAVTTDDFMTAEWTKIPFDVLDKAARRITNEVKGISRVVYDITSKPPATVEFE